MEMERTRRSMDRNREIAVKKPRLSEEAERDRGANSGVPARVPSRVPGAGGSGQSAVDPRFRLGERQREDSGRGGGGPYQPQQQQQQMQELVAEYKTALAELTFNSKPIITNLTIIAGENIHAAKGIAATICSHILEVPSDQKLPSLYLLDSIVKNIGRDYIKYFAARLPEVFCKAYRQVDSSIHPGMRHLYGTWKGVFPPTPLQLIEKELFPPAVNNSSSRGTDSQSASQPRPSHSIHVNPKYLEARQRLQQSSHPKATNNNDVDSSTNSAEDQNRPDRTSRTGNARAWVDPSIVAQNVQYPLKELVSEPSRKSSSSGDRDPEYAIDVPQYSDPKRVRTNKRAMEQSGLDKSQYGTTDSGFDSFVEPMNGFEFQHGKYKEIASSQISGQKPPNSQTGGIQVSSRNWKNSEEEEYMWDDMSSKLPDPIVPWKGERNSEDSQKKTNVVSSNWMDTYWNKFNAPLVKASREERFPYSVEFGEKVSPTLNEPQSHPMTHRDSYSDSLYSEEPMVKSGNPSLWLPQETSANIFKHTSGAAAISSQLEAHHAPFSSALSVNLKSSFSNAGPTARLGSAVGAASSNLAASSSNSSPQSTSIPLLKSHIHSLDHAQSQLELPSNHIHMQNSEQSNRPSLLSSQFAPDRFPVKPPGHKSPSQHNTEPAVSQNSLIVETSSTYASFPDLSNHIPLPRQSQHGQSVPQRETQSHLAKETGKPLSRCTSPNTSADTSVQSSTADLLAAIMKNRLVSGFPVGLHQSPNLQPPLPSGAIPLQSVVPSIPVAQPSSGLDPGACSKTLSSEVNPARAVNPPLPPGPPPHASILSQLASSTDVNLNPLSNLLSSLVAKGILSSHGRQTQSTDMVGSNCAADTSSQLPSETAKRLASNSEVAVPVKDALPNPSSGIELSQTGDSVLSSEPEEDLKDLIGFEFRPEIIRGLHTVVINALYDDLKHQCRRCGLRFRFPEQLDKHLSSHDLRKLNLANLDSRKWFSNLKEFFSRSSSGQSHSIDDDVLEATASDVAQNEPMVPADESQCICIFCGEPFEDVYCHLRGMWMYKGAVYMILASEKQKLGGSNKDATSGLIVHAHCMHENSKDGL